MNFNSNWLLGVGDFEGAQEEGFDDSNFEAVTLPHAWNEDDAFRLDIHNHRTGIAWYRKQFVLPEQSEEGKVYIEFEGARQLAEVWINGNRVGGHENGVMAFGFDITRFVRSYPETNVISVRTDNAWDTKEFVSGQGFQWSDQNFNANYGGLPKNVKLHLTGILHQTLPLYSSLGYTGVYVYPSDIKLEQGTAVINVESEVVFEPRRNQAFEFEVEIFDRDGKSVSVFSGGEFVAPQRGRVVAKASSRVDGLNFWSWGYGYLYNVVTRLKVDGEVVDEVRTKTGFRKMEFRDGMVLLNERPIHVKGYAQRSSNEWPALGLSVPPWLSDYSNGLMVESGANMVRWMHVTPWKQDVESCDRVGLMQMLPAGDSERDAVGRKWLQRLELMRDAIVYNRNNPSVAVYEGGNNDISEEHMRELRLIKDQFDPHGGRAIGSRNMLGSEEAEYGGEMLYINKSAGIPYWQTEYSRDEGLRKYWDELSPPYHKDGDGPLYKGSSTASYNRNQDSHAIENVVRWYDYWKERPGTGNRVNGGGLNIVFSDTNTHYRGAENYRRSGEVDPMRIPKDGFYAHQVMWNGWVDPATPKAHIIGHWNYEKGTVKDVYVVSNSDQVELMVNGKSLGEGEQSSRFLFTFKDVAWESGTIEALGKDSQGAVVCRAKHETAGKPYALRLSQIGPAELKADGADVLLAEVEVVDKQGRRNPIALNEVDFSLDGPAEWKGGIAQGPDNYILSKKLPVECGVNRVLVRTLTEAGEIKLTAKSKGLKSASITVDSLPFESANGYSDRFPDENLKGSLAHGPTPSGASITMTRVPAEVVKSSSDSESDSAFAHDDNEATAWIGNDAIEFTFGREVTLTELTMKVGGFRARSYPIRIMVDETEVFFGATERSLGYITLDLKPIKGWTLKIVPLAGGEARDAFGDITELVDQGNATTGEENVGDRELSIIEIEFYESMPNEQAFDLYLLMGQSNMAGRDLTGLPNQTTSGQVLAYGYDGEWLVAKDPIHKQTGRIKPGVGPGIAFAQAMQAAHADTTIGVVPCAVGGSPLRRWVKGGDLYEETLLRAREAMAYGNLKGVIWHQGESDSDSQKEAETYETRLRQMIADLREDLQAPDLPVVVGQLGGFLLPEKQPFSGAVNQAIRNIDLSVSHVGYASSVGLSHKGDDLHFDAASSRKLGERFAVAMQELQAQADDPDVSVRQVDADRVVPLWPEGQMPGVSPEGDEEDLPWRGDRVQRITNTGVPAISLYLASSGDSTAPTFIVCPGGGYSYLAYNKEGVETAAWLNSLGLNAAILKYRTPNNREGAFQDVQRAVRLLRSNADALGLDEASIGVIGFSAGGHLSARASALHGRNSYEAIDEVDEFSSRPDFTILVYPAYLDNRDGAISEDFTQLDDVPPTLIVHSEDDESFVLGSKLYDAELTKAGSAHEYILYQTGGHGFGLRSDRQAKVWPQDAEDWMRKIGILQNSETE
nr:sialate O-acetylesterase [Pelagicoccus albus]